MSFSEKDFKHLKDKNNSIFSLKYQLNLNSNNIPTSVIIAFIKAIFYLESCSIRKLPYSVLSSL